MSEYTHRECEDTMYSDAYAVHVSAMTSEGLHRKSEIALELAARDNRITELQQANEAQTKLLAELWAAWDYEGNGVDPMYGVMQKVKALLPPTD